MAHILNALKRKKIDNRACEVHGHFLVMSIRKEWQSSSQGSGLIFCMLEQETLTT